MITDLDQGMMPMVSLQDIYAMSDNAECMESLHHVLDMLVERSLGIAMADGSSSTVSEELS